MKAYYFDNAPGDQRLPHDSGRAVSIDELGRLGIWYKRAESVAEVDELATARGYKNRDEIAVSPSLLGERYEPMMRNFFDEHLHEDEEIRWCLDGSGYFDVRSRDDEWVRILVEKDDLIIVPAGIYHRFTPDEKDYIKAMRLFKDEPKWTPLKRGPELDENKYRKAYVDQYQESGVAAS